MSSTYTINTASKSGEVFLKNKVCFFLKYARGTPGMVSPDVIEMMTKYRADYRGTRYKGLRLP